MSLSNEGRLVSLALLHLLEFLELSDGFLSYFVAGRPPRDFLCPTRYWHFMIYMYVSELIGYHEQDQRTSRHLKMVRMKVAGLYWVNTEYCDLHIVSKTC